MFSISRSHLSLILVLSLTLLNCGKGINNSGDITPSEEAPAQAATDGQAAATGTDGAQVASSIATGEPTPAESPAAFCGNGRLIAWDQTNLLASPLRSVQMDALRDRDGNEYHFLPYNRTPNQHFDVMNFNDSPSRTPRHHRRGNVPYIQSRQMAFIFALPSGSGMPASRSLVDSSTARVEIQLRLTRAQRGTEANHDILCILGNRYCSGSPGANITEGRFSFLDDSFSTFSTPNILDTHHGLTIRESSETYSFVLTGEQALDVLYDLNEQQASVPRSAIWVAASGNSYIRSDRAGATSPKLSIHLDTCETAAPAPTPTTETPTQAAE